MNIQNDGLYHIIDKIYRVWDIVFITSNEDLGAEHYCYIQLSFDKTIPLCFLHSLYKYASVFGQEYVYVCLQTFIRWKK